WLAGAEVRLATRIVPVRRMIVQHAEIRTADDFQIICQAGMSNCEIIGRKPGATRELVSERHVRAVDNLRVAVIFHHDQEHVIKMAYAMRRRTFMSERTGCD